MPVEILFMPSIEWLSSEMRQDGRPATVNFSLLYGKIDLISAGISQHRVDSCPKRKFKNPVENMARACNPGGATLRRLLGLDNVANAFVGRVGTHIKDHKIFLLRSDDVHLAQIEPNFLMAGELL